MLAKTGPCMQFHLLCNKLGQHCCVTLSNRASESDTTQLIPAAVDVELQWLTVTMRKCTCEKTASKSEHVFA